MTVDERIRESLSDQLHLPDLDPDELDRRERDVRGARARSRQRRAGVLGAVAVVAVIALVATGVVARRSSHEVVRTGPTSAPAVAVEGRLLTLVETTRGALLVERSASTGEIVRTFGPLPSGGPVAALAVPDNARMAYVVVQAPETCPGTAICLYRGTIDEVPLAHSQEPPHVLATGRPVALAVSHDGRTLAWVDGGNGTESIHVRDLVTGHERTVPLARVTDQGFGVLLRAASLSFSPDGRQVAVSVTAGSSAAVEILDVDRSTIARVLQPTAAGHAWSGAVYRRSTNELVAVDHCIEWSACPTQLVTIDPGSNRSRPLLPPGVENLIARSGPDVELATDRAGTLYALGADDCAACQGPDGWFILRVGSSMTRIASWFGAPGGATTSRPVAITWIP